MSDRCENVPFGNVRAAASEGMDPRCGSRTGLLTICGDCYDTEHDLRDRIATLETAIRMRVDRFKCPIHGNAHCPEDYMLDPDGEPMHPYDTSLGGWRNGEARCGQRPTIDTILTDE